MRAILIRSVAAVLCVASCAAPSRAQSGSRPDLADVTPAFGSRTIYAEFDLKSLPAMVNLCNSAAFLDGSGCDLLWVAAIGFNATLSAYETLITAHTPLRG
ncbi:MAG TPA: hypothetical protein VFL07_09390, partial [Rudaea sp.]|nr:hypothetical protein [Rudaea sp.]